MNILGIGVDIVELSRIRLALNRSGSKFIEELLNRNEIAQNTERVMAVPFIAGRLAAKEAVAKALGTGFNGFHWHEIEIYNHPNGQPFVVLVGRADLIASQKNIVSCLVSISHSEHFAISYSMALIQGE